jgi:glycosyltransferase involved in cell wall biosynthesis
MIPAPKISIIMPAYNVARWLGAAVESILNQTFTNFELIIVDDGSNDATPEVMRNQALRDSRIRIYFNDINSGIVRTLNTALEYARGAYIARMDADDIATPDRLDKQLQYLIDHPDYSLVGSQMMTIDESGTCHGLSPCPVSHEEARKVLPYSSPVPHIWLCHADVYKKLGGYRQLAPAEDYDFLLRLDTLGLKYGNHPEALMMIRSRDGNTASVASLKQRKAQNYVLSLYKQRISNKLADSYSLKEFQNATRSTVLIEYLHKRSSAYLARSVKTPGLVRCITYLFVSVLLSPYNAQYVWRRLMYRRQLHKMIQ